MDAWQETDRLAELIGRKRELLEQIRDLSRRQVDVVAEAEMQRLMSVLAVKQSLLEQLQQLERQLDPYRDQDPDRRHWRSVQARAQCREQVERCAALLAEILVIERQSEAVLVARRDATANQLQQVDASAAATAAYTQSSAPPTARLDLTSEA